MNDASGRTLEAYDIQRLLAHLPHRYPFLLVDRIVEARGDEYGVGIKNVTFNEPHFQGHFPGQPIMPGRSADRGHGADGGRFVRSEPAGSSPNRASSIS